MEFFSESTSSRLVANQMSTILGRYDEYYQELANSNSLKTKFSKKFHETQVKRLFNESLLHFHWQARTLHCSAFVSVNRDMDGNKIPHRIVLSIYMFHTRSHRSEPIPIASITNHALQRLIQRKAEFSVMDALKAEIDFESFSIICQYSASIAEGDHTNEEFKLETKNGWACGVCDENNFPHITTWYPK